MESITVKGKYNISMRISLIYLFISSAYVIFSDHIVLLFLGKTLPNEMLTTFETYKGLAFVLITSIILFALIQSEIKANRKYIQELELQKENLLNLTTENEIVKSSLQKRNFYIETILKYLPIGLAVNKIDDGKVTFMNMRFTEIYGWTEEELKNLDSFFKNVYPDEMYRKIMKAKVMADIESRDPKGMRWEGIEITTRTGKKKIINAQNIPVFEQNLMISTVQDITEQKEAENRIRESEEKYKLLTENTNDLITLNDMDLTYLYVSPSIKILRGYEPDDLIGKNLIDNIHPDDIELITSTAFTNKLRSGLSILRIYRFKLKDGKYRWFESNFQPILDNKNELVKIVKISRDITDRIEREQEIENYQKSLKDLTIEISLIEEKQRKVIAENIHDHLSQLLVISKMKLNDLENEITLPSARMEFKTVIQYIEQALENTRKITYELSPPVLYIHGLIDTMYWLAEKIEKEHHIKTSFSTELKELKLPESNLILIFRIIQEIINNSIKHAEANNINIEMSIFYSELEIVISDDGKGFDAVELPETRNQEGGFGLFAVKERLQNLKGRMSIHSERNKGTIVKIIVPLVSN